jgi:hypothetical protein
MKIRVSYTVDLQLRHAVLTPDAIEFYADNCKYLEMPPCEFRKMGICLTQVAAICSMRGCGRISPQFDGAGGELRDPGSVSGLFSATSVAGRISLSPLRRDKGVGGSRAVGMCGLWRSNFRDGRNDFSGYADSSSGVVSSHVVGDRPEKRCQCVRVAASAGTEEL